MGRDPNGAVPDTTIQDTAVPDAAIRETAIPDVTTRAAFLAERRRTTEDRYDRRFAPTYDQAWGEITSSHAAMLQRLLDATPSGGEILDAACGTGKYWPAILASGRRVAGIDQSAGMLAVGAAKHPDVPTRRLALQDLDDRQRFDAVICVDALEFVGPEDWPDVVRRLRDAAKRAAPLYLTVELFEPDDADAGGQDLSEALVSARAHGQPVVAGEHLNDEGGYHYYPEYQQVLSWLAAAGIVVDDTLEADSYLHILGHRST